MKRHRHLTNMKSFTSCSSVFLKLCKLQQYFSIFKASLQQCDSNVCAKYNLGRSVQFLSFAWSYYLMGYFEAVWQKKTCYHFAFVLPTEQFLNCFLHRNFLLVNLDKSYKKLLYDQLQSLNHVIKFTHATDTEISQTLESCKYEVYTTFSQLKEN